MRTDAVPSSLSSTRLQGAIGEFVGGAFFTPMIKSMQNSTFKTRFSSGGRGEDAFGGQMAVELGKSLGHAGMRSFGTHLYKAVARRLEAEKPEPRTSMATGGAIRD